MEKFMAVLDDEVVMDDGGKIIFDSRQKMEKSIEEYMSSNYIDTDRIGEIQVYLINQEFKLCDKPDGLRYNWGSA